MQGGTFALPSQSPSISVEAPAGKVSCWSVFPGQAGLCGTVDRSLDSGSSGAAFGAFLSTISHNVAKTSHHVARLGTSVENGFRSNTMLVPSYCGTLTFLCSRFCYIITETFSAVFLLLRNVRVHQMKELQEDTVFLCFRRENISNFPVYLDLGKAL